MIDWPEQPQQRPLIGGNPAAGPAYLRTTGRFGLAATNQSDQLAKALGCQLRDIRQPGACLILGSGEFMYLPMRTASFMGQEVFFHTTTRSPILSQSRDDYPIFNKRSFPSVEQPDVPNYVYGIPNDRDYRDIFVLFERVVSDENLNELNRVLADIQGIRLYFVDVVGQRMYQAREGKEKK